MYYSILAKDLSSIQVWGVSLPGTLVGLEIASSSIQIRGCLVQGDPFYEMISSSLRVGVFRVTLNGWGVPAPPSSNSEGSQTQGHHLAFFPSPSSIFSITKQDPGPNPWEGGGVQAAVDDAILVRSGREFQLPSRRSAI